MSSHPSRQPAEKPTSGKSAEDQAHKSDDAASTDEVQKQRTPTAHRPELEYDYSNFFSGAGDDPFDVPKLFDNWYSEARDAGYYLFGQPMRTGPLTRVDITEKKHHEKLDNLINFASYNYLGLSYRPEVIEAVIEATRKYGSGASGSPILSGTLDLHEELCERLAKFKKKDAVILFPSGYSANLGIISGLMRSGDLVITDQYAHASVVDGIILSKAKVRYFRHNSERDLERKLRDFTGKKLVVVEGVYSMDGDLAKLPEIVDVCRRHGARIMIDEAHSAFLFGENGRGVSEHFGLCDEMDLAFGTFSKTLGGIGGYLAGPKTVIHYLRGFARARLFSCALPPGVCAGVLKALDIVEAEPELRKKLWENTAILQGLLKKSGVDIGDSNSQVIPIMIRDDERIFSLAEEIIHEGVYLNPVRYPAVSKHRSRFRISVTAAHTKEELEEGARIITRVLRRHGLCH
jgi:glycine C-acetyltransferase